MEKHIHSTNLALIWVRILGVDSIIGLDVFERIVHKTSVASFIAKASRAVNQILFTQWY